jgi:hypothetical protein
VGALVVIEMRPDRGHRHEIKDFVSGAYKREVRQAVIEPFDAWARMIRNAGNAQTVSGLDRQHGVAEAGVPAGVASRARANIENASRRSRQQV